MTWLSDSSELVTDGWLSSAYAGHGIRGDAIPSTGDNGPPPLYNDISLPADAASEFRIEVLTLPAAGTLVVKEDSSFIFSGAPDGIYTWTYQAYKDGPILGGINTVTMTVGTVAGAQLAGDAAAAASASGQLSTAVRLAAAALAQASASGALSANIALAGAAADQISASGILTTQIRLAGNALDQVGASGTLTVQIAGLGGDAIAQTLATGNLATGIRLAGASLSVSTASGALFSVPVSLEGAAISASLAGGLLSTQIRLAGAAVAMVQVTAALDGGTVGGPVMYSFYGDPVVRRLRFTTEVSRVKPN